MSDTSTFQNGAKKPFTIKTKGFEVFEDFRLNFVANIGCLLTFCVTPFLGLLLISLLIFGAIHHEDTPKPQACETVCAMKAEGK